MRDNLEDIELVFSPSEKVKKGIEEAGAAEEVEKIVAKLSDITKWFQNYKVDSIELSIEGALQTGAILKLFVSAEGKGGCKVTLKPSQEAKNENPVI